MGQLNFNVFTFTRKKIGDGNNMRWKEKLYYIYFASKLKVSLGEVLRECKRFANFLEGMQNCHEQTLKH